ncbi:putative histone-lysine N-methyltransferase PRDM6 [Dendronephthya gigantea]|uniref:putative histone-lysine N-methyltransferase PRDM6 n=1 Tax=Dendronephthya gigantea TaxID=151771 RepID=UPI001069B888|nr:putative histone-lysine N-methyltransferase PRDM6 [Dendronephthya gigantea]
MTETSPQSSSRQDKPSTQLEITKELLEGFLYGKKRAQFVDVHSGESKKRRWTGREDGSNRKIQSLWCEECCKHIQGECPIHHTSKPKLTYAVGSFPPEVRLCTSSIPEYTYGACAGKQMPRGTWIGPYEGRRVYSSQIPSDKDNVYIWEIYENGQFSHFLDGSDENISSWMRFIRCARYKAEQNMSVIQYGKNIYYYAIRDIEVGDEMLVWYHECYYQFWGVPLVLAHELDAQNGPPIPPAILQPVLKDAAPTSQQNQGPHSAPAVTSPHSAKPYRSPGILQQYAPHKSFQFPKQIPRSIPSKGNSLPTKLSYSPVSVPMQAQPDTSVSPAQHHQPQITLPYPPVSPVPRPYLPPNVPAPYPQLPKSSIPHPQSAVKISTHYPAMAPQSTPYTYPPQSGYPPVPPGTILYQPSSTHYQVVPSPGTPQDSFLARQRQIAHSMGPPSSHIARTSPSDKPSHSSIAVSETQRAPTSPQKQVAVQIPQQFPPESRVRQESSSSQSSHASQQPISHQSPCADQQTTIQSSRRQRVRAYYETDGYASRAAERSSMSPETDQWTTGEVKENMPLGGTKDYDAVLDSQQKNTKYPQTLKATPLQNLTPSIHNNRLESEPPDKQHNQVSSTVRNVKDQDISWTCGQCGVMFAQQVTLRMHVCSKAPENPFHCGHCSNTFSTSSELREHVVTHSTERPFKCGFCGRSFAGATTLGNHMRTHTGQRPYECKVCGQTFAIATQLSRHLRPPSACGLRQKEVGDYNQPVDITVEQ